MAIVNEAQRLDGERRSEEAKQLAIAIGNQVAGKVAALLKRMG